ncbi:MAG: hypothetical protein IJ294_01675 [Clostridia bacterium]|nr:hypothetical protein [Clostridia bacterium]
MAKRKEKKNLNQRADQFYDYLIGRKGQILRFITAILVTALAEFFLKRFLFPEPQVAMVPFLLRFLLLFPILKYWVYRELHQDIFIVLKQIMITVMAVIIIQFVINYLTIFLANITGHPIIMNYICRALAEVLYFLLFQFWIFKDKND